MRISDAKFLEERGSELNLLDLYQDRSDDLITNVRDLVSRILAGMEERHSTFVLLGEEDITYMICLAINSSSSLFVATAESNSNGHVDLTITAPTFANELIFKYKGEAKIWKGEGYCIKGFDQLNNYLTGQPPMAFFLYYYRGEKHCDSKFDSYLGKLLISRGGTRTKTSVGRFATTNHTHATGSNYILDHFTAWLPKPQKKVIKKKTVKKSKKKMAKKVSISTRNK